MCCRHFLGNTLNAIASADLRVAQSAQIAKSGHTEDDLLLVLHKARKGPKPIPSLHETLVIGGHQTLKF